MGTYRKADFLAIPSRDIPMASDSNSAQASAAVLAIPQLVSSPLTKAAIFLVVTINPGNENRAPVLSLCADLSALLRSVGFRALKGCLSYGDLVRNLTHKELAQHCVSIESQLQPPWVT